MFAPLKLTVQHMMAQHVHHSYSNVTKFRVYRIRIDTNMLTNNSVQLRAMIINYTYTLAFYLSIKLQKNHRKKDKVEKDISKLS